MHRISNISLLQIEIFLRVAENHNISQTAELMYMSQSAVTRWIQKLENVLNVTLFARTNRGMILTPEGRHLYNELSHAFHITNAALLNAQTATGNNKSHLRIAIMNLNEIYDNCSPAINHFQNTHPEYTVDISICSLIDLREGLMLSNYDCVFSYESALNDIANMELRHIRRMETFFAVPSDSPAITDGKLNYEDLNKHHLFVSLQGQQLGATQSGMDICIAHGFRPNRIVYISETQEIEEAVYDKYGLFVVGPGFKTRHGDKVCMFKANKSPDFDRHIVLGWFPENSRTEVRAFAEAIPCFKVSST